MWAAILGVALKLLEFILDRAKEKKELEKKFQEFLGKRENKVSADLRASYKAQVDRLNELRKLRD